MMRKKFLRVFVACIFMSTQLFLGTVSTTAAQYFDTTALYSCDFNSTFGNWQYSGGNWNVTNGKLCESAAGTDFIALDGNVGWGYYSVQAEFTYVSGIDIGLVFWAKDSNNYYMFRPWYNGGNAGIYKRTNGSYSTLYEAPSILIPTGTHTFKVECYGSNIKCYVDNILFLAYDHFIAYGGSDDRYGKIGLRVSSSSSVQFDNVQVFAGHYDPPADTRTGNGDIMPRQPAPASVLDHINIIGSDNKTRLMVTTLQGLVNRVQPRIYVDSYYADPNDDYDDYADSDARYRTVLADKGGYTFNAPYTDPYALVKDYMTSRNITKAIIYDDNWWNDPEKAGNINVVMTMCGVYDAVALTQGQKDTLASRGAVISTVYDTRTYGWATSMDAYTWAKANLWSQCCPALIAHDTPQRQMTVDYFVANKIFVFWLQEYSDVTNTQKARALLFDLLNDMPVLSGVIGVWGVDHRADSPGGTKYWADIEPYCAMSELALMSSVSGRGHYFQCTWQNNNLSLLSGTSRSNIGTNNTITTARGNKNLYMTFVLSDGDNLGVALRQRQRQFDDSQFANHYLGYTFSNLMYDLCPLLLKDYYDKARVTNTAYIFGSHGLLGYEKMDVFGMSYLGGLEAAWDKLLSWGKKYNDYCGFSSSWVLFTNLGGSSNSSLRRSAGTTGLEYLFHDFFPEPGQMYSDPDIAYNNSIHRYTYGTNKVDAFQEASCPDGAEANVQGTYAYRQDVHVAQDVNAMTPRVGAANYYIFVGLRGFTYTPSRIPGVWDQIIAQPRIQALVNAGYGINLVRPDTFNRFYKQYNP